MILAGSALDVFGNLPFMTFWFALCAEGAALSWLTLRDPDAFSDNPRLHAWLFPATALLFGGLLWTFDPPFKAEKGMLTNPYLLGHGNIAPVMILMAPMGLCWMVFAAKTAAFYLTEQIPRILMGDHRLVVKRTFDKAEALVKRGEVDRAFKLYTEAAQKAPRDPAPRLAMADLFLARGARAQGEAMLKQAADCAPDVHARAPVLFRISDLRRDAGDAAGARRILQDFLAEGPPEPYLAAARERIERLA